MILFYSYLLVLSYSVLSIEEYILIALFIPFPLNIRYITSFIFINSTFAISFIDRYLCNGYKIAHFYFNLFIYYPIVILLFLYYYVLCFNFIYYYCSHHVPNRIDVLLR